MEKQDLLDFLEDKSDELDFDGNIDIYWNKKAKTFELEFTFFVENKDDQMITDALGVESDEDIISFSDSVLLYDETKPVELDENDYLACLSYAGKKGWSLAKGKAFFAYLQTILDNGESDLLDFINDNEKETFELAWSNEVFESYLAKEKAEDQKVCLPYPKF